MRLLLHLAALAAAVACTDGLRALAGPPALEYMAGVVVPRGPGVAGLSGLHVSGDGSLLVAVSDFGTVVRARLRHDPDGRLVDVLDPSVADLGGFDAAQPKPQRDSEALAALPGGGWLVAFEVRSRVLAYPPGPAGLRMAPRQVALPRAARRLPRNRGIEALAVAGDGTLVAIAEDGGDDGATHPAWIRRDGRWEAHTYRTAPDFSPTDAAFLPGGDLLVLERSFALLPGFRARLMLVPAEALAGDDPLEGTELGRIAPLIGVDNFEGLAVRPAGNGDAFVYIVSDDNAHPLQRTLLVQYRLRVPAPVARTPAVPSRVREGAGHGRAS